MSPKIASGSAHVRHFDNKVPFGKNNNNNNKFSSFALFTKRGTKREYDNITYTLYIKKREFFIYKRKKIELIFFYTK